MTLRILVWNVKGTDAKASTAALEHLPPLVRKFKPQVLTLIEAPPSAEAFIWNRRRRTRSASTTLVR
jgi:hypothetical protein